MKCRAYKLYGASEIARVEAYSRSAIMGWLHDWHAKDYPVDALEIHVREGLEDLERPWMSCAQQGNSGIAVELSSDFLSGLPWLLLGVGEVARKHDQGGVLEEVLLEEVIQDLARRFMHVPDRSELNLSRGPVYTDVNEPGSGYLTAVVTLSPTYRLRLVLVPDVVENICKDLRNTAERTPIANPRQAIEKQSVGVEVVVGSGEISIEELASLAVGDVIPLDSRLNDEIALRLNNEAPFGHGYLGTKNGKYAAQISTH